jgi:hypothetical protein
MAITHGLYIPNILVFACIKCETYTWTLEKYQQAALDTPSQK